MTHEEMLFHIHNVERDDITLGAADEPEREALRLAVRMLEVWPEFAATVNDFSEESESVGSWLSAPLEDDGTCDSMKQDVVDWMATLEALREQMKIAAAAEKGE